MIKVINKTKNGLLYHYSHFIKDCLIPEINLGFQDDKLIIRKKNTWQTLGNFGNLYEEILGNTNLEIIPKMFDSLSLETIDIQVSDFHNKRGFNCFRDFIFNRYSVIPTEYLPDYPEIILIERGEAVLIDDEKLAQVALRPENGKQRREISNIESLKSFIAENYPLNSRTVVLENVSFEEQVKLFNNAKLIIGCHGAGLVNTIFCKENSCTVIEVSPVDSWSFFKKIGNVLSLEYLTSPDNLEIIKELIINRAPN